MIKAYAEPTSRGSGSGNSNGGIGDNGPGGYGPRRNPQGGQARQQIAALREQAREQARARRNNTANAR